MVWNHIEQFPAVSAETGEKGEPRFALDAEAGLPLFERKRWHGKRRAAFCSARRLYAWLSRHWLTRSSDVSRRVAVRANEAQRPACGSAQHDARGGELRQGMACGIPRCGGQKRGLPGVVCPTHGSGAQDQAAVRSLGLHGRSELRLNDI
jgi:hypothetical protein